MNKRFWRIAIGAHAGLDGEGARLYGGRWNSEGTSLVYASTHLSLAVIEVLVHVPPHLWPDQARAFAIDLPDSAVIEDMDKDNGILDRLIDCRSFGDNWAIRRSAQAILVPSMIVPRILGNSGTDEANALLNPAFAANWTVEETPFRLDERLRRHD